MSPEHRGISTAPSLAGVVRAAAPGITALVALLLAGCPDNSTERCYRDLERDACQTSCKAGDTGSCGALEQIEARSGDLGAQQSRCKRGDMFACSDLARRQTDPAARRKILEEACALADLGGPACAELADLTSDPHEKRKILERACAMPSGQLACARLRAAGAPLVPGDDASPRASADGKSPAAPVNSR
jgi:hypothetical protein